MRGAFIERGLIKQDQKWKASGMYNHSQFVLFHRTLLPILNILCRFYNTAKITHFNKHYLKKIAIYRLSRVRLLVLAHVRSLTANYAWFDG